jgi:hypothetical protein
MACGQGIRVVFSKLKGIKSWGMSIDSHCKVFLDRLGLSYSDGSSLKYLVFEPRQAVYIRVSSIFGCTPDGGDTCVTPRI